MKVSALSGQQKTHGSTLVIALLTIAVLSVVGATVLMSVSVRYGYTQQAVGWEEALGIAEAGADFALANCRWTINGNSTPWNGWRKYNTIGRTWIPVTSAADGNAELAAGRKIIYDLPSGSHLVGSGQGSTDGWYHVEVDAPASMVVGSNRWYRIRSTGYTGLPGPARVGGDRPDGTSAQATLRKIDLKVDHFIARYGDYDHVTPTRVSVATPRAARRIEVVAQPVTPFGYVIMTTDTSGTPLSNPLIDSYDSSDTVHYPGGLYNSAVRDPNTGIGVNAPVYVNAPISSLVSAVYGDVTTAGGTLTKGNNITGTVLNNGTLPVPTVSAPSWGTVASQPAPAMITAGTTSSPLFATYTRAKDITVTLPVGQTKGVANLYVTGDVTGGITVAKGVTLKIWMGGNFSMKASDIDNLNENAAYLQIYGIDPATGTSRTIDIASGSPGYHYVVFDAPSYDFTNNGNPDLCGSIVAKTVTGNGNTTWHYDEALATAGQPTDYKRAMWVEDER
jgi:hypothetical protein